MNRLTFAALLVVLISCKAGAQSQEWKSMKYKNGDYSVFKIKADTTVAASIYIADNIKRQNEKEFFKSLGATLRVPYFAITASIVDSICWPLGLYIADGKTVKHLNAGSGVGNFYLVPNGFIAIDTASVSIAKSGDYDATKYYKWAIQSGPMLVIDGNIHPGFSASSKNKNTRCAVGISTSSTGDYLYFVKTNTPSSFYALAELFLEKLNCKNALNLESSSNCSIHLPSLPVKSQGSAVICRYIILPL